MVDVAVVVDDDGRVGDWRETVSGTDHTNATAILTTQTNECFILGNTVQVGMASVERRLSLLHLLQELRRKLKRGDCCQETSAGNNEKADLFDTYVVL